MSRFTEVAGALSGARNREADEFAALLEGGRVPAGHPLTALVGLTRALAPAEHSPAPTFRTALRERLLAEAATRAPAVPAQRSPHPRRPARTRLSRAVAAVAVASVVAGVGAAAASTAALPGAALYGLKLRIESVQLKLAGSDLERGREFLEQAQSRLGEAERLAASSAAGEPATRRELVATLTRMEQATAAGAAALTESYRATGDREPLLLLDRFVARQQDRLGDLLALLDPELRARVSTMFDALGTLGGYTGAILATATRAGRGGDGPGGAGRDPGDGWAVSRLSDQTATSGQAADSLAGGTLGAATGGGDPAADPLGTVVGGGSPVPGDALGGSSAGSGAVGTDLGSGGAASPPAPAPLPAAPLPAAPSLPAPAPLPTAPSLPAPASLPAAPLPTVSACVPLPPLTSC